MMLFIKKGVEVLVMSEKNKKQPMTLKTIKADRFYGKESILIDPVGKLGYHKESFGSIGGQFARAGFYGIKLPKNRFGYDYMLIHEKDIQVL